MKNWCIRNGHIHFYPALSVGDTLVIMTQERVEETRDRDSLMFNGNPALAELAYPVVKARVSAFMCTIKANKCRNVADMNGYAAWLQSAAGFREAASRLNREARSMVTRNTVGLQTRIKVSY